MTGDANQYGNGRKIDEHRRRLLKPFLGVVAYLGLDTDGVTESASGVQMTKADQTGAGTAYQIFGFFIVPLSVDAFLLPLQAGIFFGLVGVGLAAAGIYFALKSMMKGED